MNRGRDRYASVLSRICIFAYFARGRTLSVSRRSTIFSLRESGLRESWTRVHYPAIYSRSHSIFRRTISETATPPGCNKIRKNTASFTRPSPKRIISEREEGWKRAVKHDVSPFSSTSIDDSIERRFFGRRGSIKVSDSPRNSIKGETWFFHYLAAIRIDIESADTRQFRLHPRHALIKIISRPGGRKKLFPFLPSRFFFSRCRRFDPSFPILNFCRSDRRTALNNFVR